jgi:hypothetical protein
MPNTAPSATGSTEIAAAPEAVYVLITDLQVLAELAEETAVMRWHKGEKAAPGAVFKGTNRNGWRRWTTTCTVTDAEPGRRFAFLVSQPAGATNPPPTSGYDPNVDIVMACIYGAIAPIDTRMLATAARIRKDQTDLHLNVDGSSAFIGPATLDALSGRRDTQAWVASASRALEMQQVRCHRADT